MASKIDSLNSMNQLLLHNQTLLLEKLEDVQSTLQVVKAMVYYLMEPNHLVMGSYPFAATGNDVPTDYVPPFPEAADVPIPEVSHFSPINLEDI